MVRKYIGDYTRVRNGKTEEVKWHFREVNRIPKLTKTMNDKIRLGKAKKLLDENDKYVVKCLEEENIRIPIWFFKFRFKWDAYHFREKHGRFPNNKERIMICLNEWGSSYFSIKDLAEHSAIDYKNISRYIKELEKDREIVVRPTYNNQKEIMTVKEYESLNSFLH